MKRSRSPAEDRQRTASIRENLERKALESTAGSVDDYLAQLDIKVQLAPFDEANLPRIVQLINKTNQFNLTTRRRGRRGSARPAGRRRLYASHARQRPFRR